MFSDAGVSCFVVGTRDGDVVAFDGAGAERWRTALGGPISTWPTVADVPGRGLSILVATESGNIACLSPDGVVRWCSEMESSATEYNSVGLARANGAAVAIVTDRSGRVSAFDCDGRSVWRFAARPEPECRRRHPGRGGSRRALTPGQAGFCEFAEIDQSLDKV